MTDDRPIAPYERAIEESAKTIGKLTDATTGLGSFVARVFAPTIQELADWSHDAIASKRRLWKLRNIENTLEQVRRVGIEGGAVRQIPARQQGPILDAIANEDDEHVQSLWATLLRRATDPDGAYAVKRVHINILKAIDPIEAKILLAVGSFLAERPPGVKVFEVDRLCAALQVSEADLTVYFHHLASLGCFIATDKTVGFISDDSPEPPPYVQTVTADFQVTLLCSSLLKAIG
jgi:hypothetical protein